MRKQVLHKVYAKGTGKWKKFYGTDITIYIKCLWIMNNTLKNMYLDPRL